MVHLLMLSWQSEWQNYSDFIYVTQYIHPLAFASFILPKANKHSVEWFPPSTHPLPSHPPLHSFVYCSLRLEERENGWRGKRQKENVCVGELVDRLLSSAYIKKAVWKRENKGMEEKSMRCSETQQSLDCHLSVMVQS